MSSKATRERIRELEAEVERLKYELHLHANCLVKSCTAVWKGGGSSRDTAANLAAHRHDFTQNWSDGLAEGCPACDAVRKEGKA